MSPNSAQYEEITARILEALERGVAPWHQPWKGSAHRDEYGRMQEMSKA